MKNSIQIGLFEQSDTQKQSWTANDIWTHEWNLAIDLAIIIACTGKWLQLKEMAGLAIEFAVGNENYPPFSYQVFHLSNIGKLKIRTNSKTKQTEWLAA